MKQSIFNDFTESFKEKSFWKVFLLDYLLWVLIVIGLYVYGFILLGANYFMPDISSIGSEAAASMLNGIYARLFIYTILFLVYVFIVYTLFKGFIWSKILNFNFKFSTVKRFILLNVPLLIVSWFFYTIYLYFIVGVSMSALTYVSNITSSPVLQMVLLMPGLIFVILPIYMWILSISNIFQLNYFMHKKNKYKISFSQVLKVNKLYPAYAFMAFIGLIFLWILSVPIFSYDSIIGTLVTLIVLVLFNTWQRFFLIRQLNKEYLK